MVDPSGGLVLAFVFALLGHASAGNPEAVRRVTKFRRQQHWRTKRAQPTMNPTQANHLAADDPETLRMIQHYASKLRAQLTPPQQCQREQLLVEIIVTEWERMQATRFWLKLPRWTSQEFKELPRRFVEAETGFESAVAALRVLRAMVTVP